MKDGLYFRHIRYLEKGVVTLAVEVKDGWVQYSYALCSPNDNFSKAIGRNISEARLRNWRKNKVSGFKLDAGLTMREILNDTELQFLDDVRTKERWISPCGWLRRSERLVSRARLYRKEILSAVEAVITGGYDGKRQLVSGA